MISIILSVFNGEKYLQHCLDSLATQTCNDFELIIINDGSTDSTEDIIHKNIERFQNCIYIFQTNKGLAYCRNKGIYLARGNYITFVDADDLVAPNMIEAYYNGILLYKTDIIYADLYSFAEKKEPCLRSSPIKNVDILSREEAVRNYFSSRMGNVCGGVFSKKILKKFRFPVGYIYEDNIVKLKTLLNADKIVFLHVNLYFYRKNINSITRIKKNAQHVDIIYIGYYQRKYMLKYYKEIFIKVKKEYYKMYSCYLLGLCRSISIYSEQDILKRLITIPHSYLFKLIFAMCFYYPTDIEVSYKLIEELFKSRLQRR